MIDKEYKKKLSEELAQYKVRIWSRLLLNENYYMWLYQKCWRYTEYFDNRRRRGGKSTGWGG